MQVAIFKNPLFLSLKKKNFRLYWFGQIVSISGVWMQTIGEAWVVLQLTHSAWQLGIVGALESFPMLIFPLFGGVIADRWQRKHVLFVTQSIEMLQAWIFFILLVTGHIQLWEVYILVVMLVIATSIDIPVRLAFVSEMVAPEVLTNAVALNSSVGVLLKIIGPAFGGVVIALWGVTSLFLYNALSFLAIIFALVLINEDELYYQEQQSNEKKHLIHDLLDGFRYIGDHTVLLWMLCIITIALLIGSNFNVVLPLLATKIFHTGSQGLGLLSGALACGALGAILLLAGKNKKTPTMKDIYLSMLLFSIVEIVLAFCGLYSITLVCILFLGFFENLYASRAAMAVQVNAPAYIRGRMISITMLLFGGSLPLGYIFMGWLANLLGVRIALLVCGAICFLVAGIALSIFQAKNMLDDELRFD